MDGVKPKGFEGESLLQRACWRFAFIGCACTKWLFLYQLVVQDEGQLEKEAKKPKETPLRFFPRLQFLRLESKTERENDADSPGVRRKTQTAELSSPARSNRALELSGQSKRRKISSGIQVQVLARHGVGAMGWGEGQREKGGGPWAGDKRNQPAIWKTPVRGNISLVAYMWKGG